MCEERHEEGARKYGPGKFLTVDTFQEALEEIVDLANYARYTYIKVRMLQYAVALAITENQVPITDQGFAKVSDFRRSGS